MYILWRDGWMEGMVGYRRDYLPSKMPRRPKNWVSDILQIFYWKKGSHYRLIYIAMKFIAETPWPFGQLLSPGR